MTTMTAKMSRRRRSPSPPSLSNIIVNAVFYILAITVFVKHHHHHHHHHHHRDHRASHYQQHHRYHSVLNINPLPEPAAQPPSQNHHRHKQNYENTTGGNRPQVEETCSFSFHCLSRPASSTGARRRWESKWKPRAELEGTKLQMGTPLGPYFRVPSKTSIQVVRASHRFLPPEDPVCHGKRN